PEGLHGGEYDRDRFGERLQQPLEHPGGATPNGVMMSGYLDTSSTSTTSVTVSGLPAALTQLSYSVYVYFDGDNGGNERVGRYQIGNPTIFGRDAGGTNFSGTFTQIPNSSTTDQMANTPAGNYIIFSGLPGASFTLTAAGAFASDGTQRGPLNAIQ